MGLRIFRADMIIHYPLLPARPHDHQLPYDQIEGFQCVLLADKGFIDAFRQHELARKKGVELHTPLRTNMKVRLPPASTYRKALARADRNGRLASDQTLPHRPYACH